MVKHSPLFKKVQRFRDYEEVARQIQQAIIDQHLRVGDKLPSQKELKDMFQVSQFTILAAIRILERSGLVYTKRGATGGTFVLEKNIDGFTQSLKLLLGIKRVTLEELAEFRLIIEGQAAYWAAKRRKTKDLKKMEVLLDTMRRLLPSNGSMEEIARIDMSFHLAVAEAVHNTLYGALMEAVNESFLKEVNSLVPQEEKTMVYADLVRIFEAIKARKARAAEKAVQKHITGFSKLLIRLFREKHASESNHSRRYVVERLYDDSK